MQPSPTPSTVAGSQQPRTGDIVGQKLILPEPNPAAKESMPLPKPCAERWKQITAATLADIKEQLRQKEFGLLPECAEAERALLHTPALDQVYSAECAAAFALPTPTTAQAQCYLQLTFYRAKIVDLLSRDADPRSLSSSVLMNKILAQFSGATQPMPPESIDRAVALTDALIEKEPQLASAYKARMTLLMMRIESNPEAFEDFRRATERYAAFSPADPDLIEARMTAFKMAKDEEGFQRYAQELLQNYPQLPAAQYLQASMLWHEGKRAETIATLEKAIALDPKQQRFKDSLKKARTAKPGEPIFSSSVSFAFDDL